MPQKNLANLKHFLESKWNDKVSKQLNSYELKVKELVKELDLKSRDAREKSREQLDAFTQQVKKTRADLEKRIVTVVNQETKRLNVGLNDLVRYLKSLSHTEKKAQATVTKKAKPTTTAKTKKAKATVTRASAVTKASKRSASTKSRGAKTAKKTTSSALAGEGQLGGANSSVSSSLPH